MKVGPVTKPDKRNTEHQINLTVTSCQKTMTSLSFSQFWGNLEQSGSWILDVWSVKVTFSLTVTCYLIKTETDLKNLNNTITKL